MTGVVGRYRREQNFGWIYADGITGPIYFHRSLMAAGHRFDDARFNKRVEFELENVAGGVRAVDVRVLPK